MSRWPWFALFALILVPALPARAAMVTRGVDYHAGKTALHGVLVYDDAVAAKRPALLMVPNWLGVNADAITKAKRIAGRDYVVFVADVYGAKVRPHDTKQAAAAATPLLKNRPLLRARIEAGLAKLRAESGSAPIDPRRIAAIGFCFGGTTVLDLARSGAEVAAVVSFHGGLDTDDTALARHIKAAVLAMNGADDTWTMPHAAGFRKEMQQSPAPWEFMVFGHAVHCFTEVGDNAPGCRYNAKVSARAYRLMRDWLAEAFAARTAD